MAITRRDYYIENPERQPKRAIAEYVRQNGGPVPTIFRSLDEAKTALRLGIPIIARSEHPQDYDGSSGLLESPILREYPCYLQTESDLKREVLNQEDYRHHGMKLVKEHCRLLGINFEEFKAQISYSFWELMEGFRVKVVADSAIEGRYHIVSYSPDEKSLRPHRHYALFEKDGSVRELVQPLPEAIRNNMERLIETYEAVRNLERFNPNHCPCMEFLTTYAGDHYFLQYHKTLDFEAATFSLNRDPQKGEHEALFVRGATPPGGLTYSVTLYHYSHELVDTEGGSFDGDVFRRGFQEIMLRRRGLQITLADKLEFALRNFATDHTNFSILTKPKISLVQDTSFLPVRLDVTLSKACTRTKRNTGMDIHLISDGIKAYLRIV